MKSELDGLRGMASIVAIGKGWKRSEDSNYIKREKKWQ